MLLTSGLFRVKGRASLKDCSCVKTEVELMDLGEGGLSCRRALLLQLQSCQELRGAGINNTSVHHVQTPSVVT